MFQTRKMPIQTSPDAVQERYIPSPIGWESVGYRSGDLILQFTGSDAANRFQEAWKRARIIVDTGGGHGSTPPTPPPATPHP